MTLHGPPQRVAFAMYAARLRTQVDLERQSAGVLGRIMK